MTRRYPHLRGKVLYRDSKIAQRIITAWDIEHDHEKALNIFLKENKNLSDERYWEILRSVWIIAGSVKNAPIFRKLFSSQRPKAHYFSTPEEIEKFKSLPSIITAYRATNDPNDGGLSWTLSRQYAEDYAKTFDKKEIIEQRFYKFAVFAYINRNKEEEILIID